jgi:hypothetical protein
VKAPPESTKQSLTWRLRQHARGLWPELADVHIKFRANFAYIDGRLHTGETMKLCRLRYSGSASHWGFAIYRASPDDYDDNVLPSGQWTGTPEEALDCACGLYLSAITSPDTPTN